MINRVCIITDNEFIFNEFLKIIEKDKYKDIKFDFFYSSFNYEFMERFQNSKIYKPIRFKNENKDFFKKYDLFLSLHCKQLFPDFLVKNYRCINVHPGYNPYNRGWFPQVFSILNNMPIGVTIHEMDTELDHGDIIYQETIKINEWDTSYDVYKRLQNLEITTLKQNFDNLLSGKYLKTKMINEGNINYKADFDKLCKIDLEKQGTYREVINYLRAMTFNKYNNAYFIDSNGDKIFVNIELKKNKL